MGMNPITKLANKLRSELKATEAELKAWILAAVLTAVAYRLAGDYAFVQLPGMFLPIRMSEAPTVRSGVRDYMSLIIGLFVGTLVGGILYYILGQMNQSGVLIPSKVNVIQYVFNFNPIIGLLFAMVIVIVAVVIIIRYLRHSQETWE